MKKKKKGLENEELKAWRSESEFCELLRGIVSDYGTCGYPETKAKFAEAIQFAPREMRDRLNRMFMMYGGMNDLLSHTSKSELNDTTMRLQFKMKKKGEEEYHTFSVDTVTDTIKVGNIDLTRKDWAIRFASIVRRYYTNVWEKGKDIAVLHPDSKVNSNMPAFVIRYEEPMENTIFQMYQLAGGWYTYEYSGGDDPDTVIWKWSSLRKALESIVWNDGYLRSIQTIEFAKIMKEYFLSIKSDMRGFKTERTILDNVIERLNVKESEDNE